MINQHAIHFERGFGRAKPARGDVMAPHEAVEPRDGSMSVEYLKAQTGEEWGIGVKW